MSRVAAGLSAGGRDSEGPCGGDAFNSCRGGRAAACPLKAGSGGSSGSDGIGVVMEASAAASVKRRGGLSKGEGDTVRYDGGYVVEGGSNHVNACRSR